MFFFEGKSVAVDTELSITIPELLGIGEGCPRLLLPHPPIFANILPNVMGLMSTKGLLSFTQS